MLNSETISCILEGIYSRSGCGIGLVSEKVTSFFDVYEKEIHNRITNDPDYIKLQKDFPSIITNNSMNIKNAILYWWTSNSYFGVTEISIKDNKGRKFIDPLGILDYSGSHCFEKIIEFKNSMPKAFNKLDKLGKNILKLLGNRRKLQNKFNHDLQQSTITLEILQEEYPLIYQLYEEGKKYRSK